MKLSMHAMAVAPACRPSPLAVVGPLFALLGCVDQPVCLTAAAVASPTAGVVTAAATTRQIQLALKLLF